MRKQLKTKFMFLVAITCSAVAFSGLATAEDSSLARQLVGKWQCTQQLVAESEEGMLDLKVEYTQELTRQRQVNLTGTTSMKFEAPPEMQAMFEQLFGGGNQLDYSFVASGTWKTQPGKLVVTSQSTTLTATSPLAKQLESMGMADMQDLVELEEEEVFLVQQLSSKTMTLIHAEEGFSVTCKR